MKCALEMIISTEKDRATAVERRLMEEEKARIEEERRLAKEREEARERSKQLLENILEEFEDNFKNHSSDVLDFSVTVETDLADYYCGFQATETTGYVYPLYIDKYRAYADGGHSYDTDASRPYDLQYLIQTLRELCYDVKIDYCCSYDKRHYGAGAIKRLALILKLNPDCVK